MIMTARGQYMRRLASRSPGLSPQCCYNTDPLIGYAHEIFNVICRSYSYYSPEIKYKQTYSVHVYVQRNVIET